MAAGGSGGIRQMPINIVHLSTNHMVDLGSGSLFILQVRLLCAPEEAVKRERGEREDEKRNGDRERKGEREQRERGRAREIQIER